MNTSKIGNARQQDDNRVAVVNARSLADCWQELSATFEQAELQSADYQPEQLTIYRAMRADPDSPDAQAWIKSSIMADKATDTLREAFSLGQLPLWRIHDAREVPVAPAVLERENVKHGVFKSHERPEPDMQGAKLWVKRPDWEAFIARTILPPSARLKLPPADPFVTLSDALTWIAFGVAMDNELVHALLCVDSYGDRVPQEAMKDALAELTARAGDGRIAMRGKYRENRMDDDARLLTAPIEAIKFEDYRQFSYLEDELRHGEGLLFWRSEDGTILHDLFGGGRKDSFLHVKVNRTDLLREYPPRWPVGSESHHFRVGHVFTRDDPATIAPWWTVNQSLAWIGTRTPSYVEYIGNLETDEPREHRPYIVHAICNSQVGESDEGKVFMASKRASWPTGDVLAHAGRALLQKILAGDVRPMIRERGQGRRMQSEEFVGVGISETGEDWFDLDPQPLFSSAELMAAFPVWELDPDGDDLNANAEIVVQSVVEPLAELPPWLNPYQLVAWVQYRDLAVVAKAGNWNGLAAQHLYEKTPQVGKMLDLQHALQEGRLVAHGLKSETFTPIPAIEWTRIRIAPLDLAQQHPYAQIQVRRDDALAIFPAMSAGTASNPSTVLAAGRARKRPGPAPDADWPAVMNEVASECSAARYSRPLARGQQAAIITMLLSAMAKRDKHPSEDTARKYAAQVIAPLPDNSAPQLSAT